MAGHPADQWHWESNPDCGLWCPCSPTQISNQEDKCMLGMESNVPPAYPVGEELNFLVQITAATWVYDMCPCTWVS